MGAATFVPEKKKVQKKEVGVVYRLPSSQYELQASYLAGKIYSMVSPTPAASLPKASEHHSCNCAC